MSEISPEDLRRLVTENASLADRLEASEADRKRIEESWAELRQQLDAARAELAAATEASGAAKAEAGSLRREREELGESLHLADVQLGGEPATRAIAPAEVSALIDGLIQSLESRLPGMTMSDAEMHLKVGLEKHGDTTGFVLPGATGPSEEAGQLHEVTIRLRRAPK